MIQLETDDRTFKSNGAAKNEAAFFHSTSGKKCAGHVVNKRVCSNCGGRGHDADVCPTRVPAQGKSRKDYLNYRCHICSQAGHVKYDCSKSKGATSSRCG
jgi:hypothetical protein